MNQVLNDELQHCVMNAIAYAADMAKVSIQEAAMAHATPSAIYRPRISMDGNKWCALYGENLQDGVAGFGDSPSEAMYAFDAAWVAKHRSGT